MPRTQPPWIRVNPVVGTTAVVPTCARCLPTARGRSCNPCQGSAGYKRRINLGPKGAKVATLAIPALHTSAATTRGDTPRGRVNQKNRTFSLPKEGGQNRGVKIGIHISSGGSTLFAGTISIGRSQATRAGKTGPEKAGKAPGRARKARKNRGRRAGTSLLY